MKNKELFIICLQRLLRSEQAWDRRNESPEGYEGYEGHEGHEWNVTYEYFFIEKVKWNYYY